MTIHGHRLVSGVEELNEFYPKLVFTGTELVPLLSGTPVGEFDVVFEPTEAFPEGESFWSIKTQNYGAIICRVVIPAEGGGEEPSISTVWTSNTGTFFDGTNRYGRALFTDAVQEWPISEALYGEVGDTALHLNPLNQTHPTFLLADNDVTEVYEELNYISATGAEANPTSIVDFGDYYLVGPIFPVTAQAVSAFGGPYMRVVKLDKGTNTTETLSRALPGAAVATAINSVALGGMIVPTNTALIHFDGDTEVVTSLPTPEDIALVYAVSVVKDNLLILICEDESEMPLFFLYNFDLADSTYSEITQPAGAVYTIPFGTGADNTHLYLVSASSEDGVTFAIENLIVEKRSLDTPFTIVDSNSLEFSSLESNGISMIDVVSVIAQGGNLFVSYQPQGSSDDDRLVILEISGTTLEVINRIDLDNPGSTSEYLYISHVTDEYIYVIREEGVFFIDRSDFSLSSIQFPGIYWGKNENIVRKFVIDSEDNIFIPDGSAVLRKVHPDLGVATMVLSATENEINGDLYSSETSGDSVIDFTPEESRILTLVSENDGDTVIWYIIPMVVGEYVNDVGGIS